MKISKSRLKEIIREEIKSIKEDGTIKFSKDEMAKLHKDGKLEKDGHTYIFGEGKLKGLTVPYGEYTDEKLSEAGSMGGAIDMSGMNDSYVAPKRDTTKGDMGTFLQKFSSKEARNIIDGQLKNMVKDLRRVQGKVIKTWMDGAKSGQIDFFDIIRGLKTGDVRRAHQEETDFLVSVLTRDNIVDRFRSYFKGKKGKKGRTK
jgi:hypothetical protein